MWELIEWFFLWLLWWPVIFFVSYVFIFNTDEISYTKGYQWITLYFMLFVVLIISAYKSSMIQLYQDISVMQWMLVLVHSIGCFAFYGFVRSRYKPPHRLMRKKKYEFIFKVDYRYLVAKFPAILLQQLLVYVLLVKLKSLGLQISQIVVLFIFIFTCLHLTHIIKTGWKLGLYYIGNSAIAGILFPTLILLVPGGIVYSYMVHFCYYLGTGYFAWRKHGGPRAVRNM